MKTVSIGAVLLLIVTVVSCNQDIAGTADNSIQSAALSTTANAEGGEPCAPGSFSADGLTPCEPCQLGTYQDESGQTSCKPAPAGKFVSEEGAIQATDCPVGRYQDKIGQISCIDAEPGSFVSTEGAAQAELCPIGTFSNFSGASECTACDVGETTDGPGATFCIAIVNDPVNKDDCKNGGWDEYGFKNQGQCIRFVNTGKDSRI